MGDTRPYGLSAVGYNFYEAERDEYDDGTPQQYEPYRGNGNGNGHRHEHKNAIVVYASPEMGAIQRHEEPPRPEIDVWPADLRVPYDPRLALLAEPDSERARAFRLLRHRLLRAGDPRIVVVTSPLRREGKSMVAVNLALAIGEESASRVLCFEANLRAPSLAAMLGFHPPACLAEQLSRPDENGPWVVAHALGTGVHFLNVDFCPKPHAPLDRSMVSRALRELRREYDYIIVDTPSALESADASLVADVADGILIATAARRSRARDVRKVIDQLDSAPVLGIVLTDAPSGAKD